MIQNRLILALLYAAGPCILIASMIGCNASNPFSVSRFQAASPGGRIALDQQDRSTTRSDSTEFARESVSSSGDHIALANYEEPAGRNEIRSAEIPSVDFNELFDIHAKQDFSFDFSEGHGLDEVLDEMLEVMPFESYEIMGPSETLVNAEIAAVSMNDAFRQLEMQAGVRVVILGSELQVYADPLVVEDIENELLYDVLSRIVPDGNFRIVGGEPRINAVIRAYSIDDALQQLEQQTGVRFVRRGSDKVIAYVNKSEIQSLTYFEKPLEEVMRTLANSIKGDYRSRIVGKGTKKITALISSGSTVDALRDLEDQSGILIVEEGKVFVAYSDAAELELNGQPITYVYKCRHAKAWDLISIVENQAPEGFPKAGDPHVPGSATATDSIIKSHEPNQISDNMPNTGLTSPLGATEYQIVHHLNSVVLQGQYQDVREAVEFLRMIDRKIPIVFVKLLIVQYFHEDSYAWRYNFFDGQIAKGDPFVTDGNGFGAAPISETPPGPGNFFGPRDNGINVEDLSVNALTGNLPMAFSTVGDLTVNFQQNIKHLVRENQARVVTNPHVAVINGHKGTILQNETFNFTLNDVATGVSTTVSERLEKLDAITALTVTPTVIGPEQIHLAVNATLSVFLANVAGGLLQDDLPDQRQNDLATSVVLRNEQTLMIGGLVREEMVEERDKYPLLSKTPLIGNLFRRKLDNKRFIETVIYITPQLEQTDKNQDEYMKQVFKYTQRKQDLGESIRSENRMDKERFEQQYRENECLDYEQHELLKQEKKVNDKQSRQLHRPQVLHRKR